MNDANNIVDVNEQDFNNQVVEDSINKLIIVDFWAPWCGPCKQLTPILEKVIASCNDKVKLVKINIDENQQIAAQLRIQSIPTVYAFKDKQILNAFQGVLPEKQIIDFIEKCLGSKINEDFEEFYKQIELAISEHKFEESKDTLLEFISANPKDIKAISLYLECLLSLKQIEDAESFIESLEKEIQKKDEIKQIFKKIKIIKNNLNGPNIDDLIEKLEKKPNDINLILDIADKYFANQNYDDSFDLLLKYYPKHRDSIKNKMVEFFNVLGHSNKYTVEYRKKLSQVMFS